MISVVIPVFNAADTIKRCIDSILNQSFNNFEIIVINDGSTDKTGKVLEQYCSDSIHVYNAVNRGVSSARNYGLSKARGEWVTFIDADDWIEREMFSEFVKSIDNDTDVISVNIQYDGPIKKEASYRVVDNSCVMKKEIIETTIDLYYGEKRFGAKYGNSRCIGGKFYRRAMLERGEIVFNGELTGFEDGIFNLYSYQTARKIKVLGKKLYHYVYNSSSRTSIGAGREQINQDLMTLSKVKVFLNETCQKSQAIKYCCINMASTAVRHIVDNDSNEKKSRSLQHILKKYELFLGDKRLDMKYIPVKRRILYALWSKNMFNLLVFLYKVKF